jgi:hypothetical protein
MHPTLIMKVYIKALIGLAIRLISVGFWKRMDGFVNNIYAL